jgi:hypothetical protein
LSQLLAARRAPKEARSILERAFSCRDDGEQSSMIQQLENGVRGSGLESRSVLASIPGQR